MKDSRKVHSSLIAGDEWIYGDRKCGKTPRNIKNPWRASDDIMKITCKKCIKKLVSAA